MPDKPVIHGPDHRPGGMDSSQPGQWVYVSNSSSSSWDSGINYGRGDTVGDGVYNYVCVLANGPSAHDTRGLLIGAYDPGVTGGWTTYWAIKQPIFQNGWDNQGGGLQTMRFRISVGRYNQLDRITGAIIMIDGVPIYSDHQLEIQGSVAGGAYVSLVFHLPPAYWPQNDLRLPASDDLGGFIPYSAKLDGSVWRGVA